MKFVETTEDKLFRQEVREWLHANKPKEQRPDDFEGQIEFDRSWQRTQYEGGWAGISWPKEYGGRGLSPSRQLIWCEEFARLRGPAVHDSFWLSLNHAGPTLIARGTEDQKALHLPRILRGEAAWCQGFSEPNAGSDLASLRTRAVIDGDHADTCTDDSLTMHVGELALEKAIHWIPSRTAPLLMRAQVMLAAALTGLAEHACEMTVEYARIREQFGKPIGTFQAVKHRCADMGVRARLAWYQTNLACLKVQAQAKDAELQVACALLVAADAAHENGRAGVQMHGGIGFQAECDVHWFMKRAHVYDQLAGGRLALSRKALAHFTMS